MNLLAAPPPSRRRKSASDIYRGMTLSKACAILGISEKEFRELTEVGLREAFTRRVERNELKKGQSMEAALDSQMKLHEAFQYIVRRRAASQAEKQRKFSDKAKCPQWAPAGSQDLGSLEDLTCDLSSKSMKNQENSTPYKTRDYVISPFEVGPGTPPPIDIPGLDLSGISWGGNDDITLQDGEKEKIDAEEMKSLPSVVALEKNSNHKKSRHKTKRTRKLTSHVLKVEVTRRNDHLHEPNLAKLKTHRSSESLWSGTTGTTSSKKSSNSSLWSGNSVSSMPAKNSSSFLSSPSKNSTSSLLSGASGATQYTKFSSGSLLSGSSGATSYNSKNSSSSFLSGTSHSSKKSSSSQWSSHSGTSNLNKKSY